MAKNIAPPTDKLLELLTPENKASKILGYNIQMLRKMRGYSQLYIAKTLNKSQNAVSSWELGNTSPSVGDLLYLCVILEVTPNQILGFEECPELVEFIKETENLSTKVEELKKQKKELERQIKEYTEQINRR